MGTFNIMAPVERVWEIFQDPDALCRLASHCEGARRLDETHYEGVVRVRLALVTARAHILGTVLQSNPPHMMRVALQGQTTGVPGGFHGTAELWLHGSGPATHGDYVFELNVLGRLSKLGQPLFQTAGQRVTTVFAEKVSRELQARESQTGPE